MDAAKTLKHIHLKGLTSYEAGSKIQEYLVKRNLERRTYEILKKNPRMADRLPFREPPRCYPTVLSFEFDPVYTGGKREKLHTTIREIEQINIEKGVPFVQTQRGGQVTFHGPGQVVLYPILDLSMFSSLTSKCYVSALEKSVIASLQGDPYHLHAKKTENTGVWVDSKEVYRGVSIKKISSLGVNVRHNITSHGVSINCTTDLSYVNDPRFVMCGLPQFKQTSIENELGSMPTSLDQLDDIFVDKLAGRLGISDVDRIDVDRDPLEVIDDNCIDG